MDTSNFLFFSLGANMTPKTTWKSSLQILANAFNYAQKNDVSDPQVLTEKFNIETSEAKIIIQTRKDARKFLSHVFSAVP